MKNLMLKAAAWKQARPLELRDEEGQTVIEYALVVALVSVVVAVLLAGFGTNIVTWARGKVGNGFA